MDIEAGARLRSVDLAKVEGIKASIAEIGLRTPVTVAIHQGDDEWAFRLVAGAHRLEALRQLGEEFVDAFVMEGDPEDAELWEIDENFARAELSDAQRADHHVRREAILVRKGVVLDYKGGRPAKSVTKLVAYSDKTAGDLGVHPNTIRRDLRRGKKIDPAVLADVAGTDLDKGVVLDQLAATPREEQPARLEQMRSAVRLAPDPLNDPEAHEKQLAALMSAWNRAAGVVREEFLLRIDQPVFDRGAA